MATPTSDGPYVPTRLIAHFRGRSSKDQGAGWCDLWDKGESDLWDRGKPSPALIDLIEQRHDTVASHSGDGRRRTALVPVGVPRSMHFKVTQRSKGCGRGYDVVMLALHGFDAYGLEISSGAVAVAEAYAASELSQPSAYNFCDSASNTRETPGHVSFLRGDFFQKDWEANVPLESGMKFDLVYDYTFLCALPPSTRVDWAGRMADLLDPGGLLVCLEFPLYKDPKLPGPPWGLKGVYWDLLGQGGNGLLGEVADAGDQDGETRSVEGQFKRVVNVKPERSYEVGRGTDMLSVWAKK